VNPDVDVEYDPQMVRQGHDPQLEKAVEVIMDQLKKNPPPSAPHHPPYPDYQHSRPAAP
jgi:tricorn protease